jgi:hypothetical protein
MSQDILLLNVTDDGKKKAAVGKREPFTGRKAFYFAVTKTNNH